jgi:hypothetical protein
VATLTLPIFARDEKHLSQWIFDADINGFCRKFLVKVPGAAEPSAVEFAGELHRLDKSLFENLLLFDKLS